jgi:hypothetical protein
MGIFFDQIVVGVNIDREEKGIILPIFALIADAMPN